MGGLGQAVLGGSCTNNPNIQVRSLSKNNVDVVNNFLNMVFDIVVCIANIMTQIFGIYSGRNITCPPSLSVVTHCKSQTGPYNTVVNMR